MRAPRIAWLWCALVALFATGGCVASYQDALGYRARRAALRGDVEAFEGLMAEASEEKPRSPLLKPQRTVLTHFLDLAGDPRFFATIERWRAKGWVSDNLTCAIHRARFRHTRASDPDQAQRAAQVCLDRARAAAYSGERSWEIEACLDEAPFLTVTSTVDLQPYLEVVADAAEPRAVRRALLDGMTKLYLQDVNIRATNAPDLPRAGHRARAQAQREAVEARLLALLSPLEGHLDTALLAAGTDFGALELERASLTEGTSFLWRYALATGDPEAVDLVFAWVRSMKRRQKNLRLTSLGLWNRKLEPGRDAYWYACLARPRIEPAFGSARVQVAPLRSIERKDAAAKATCDKLGPGRSLLGPFPMKATLRGSVTASVTETSSVSRVRLKLEATKLVR